MKQNNQDKKILLIVDLFQLYHRIYNIYHLQMQQYAIVVHLAYSFDNLLLKLMIELIKMAQYILIRNTSSCLKLKIRHKILIMIGCPYIMIIMIIPQKIF